MYEQAKDIQTLIESAQKILIIQADNPDGDSIGSALALEQILSDMDKEPLLYCGMDMPTYLRYVIGWDRVSQDFPSAFDLSIIVDASKMALLEKLSAAGYERMLANKACIVLDHHEIVKDTIGFATITINDHTRAATGELIYLLAKQLSWPLSLRTMEYIMIAILGDTQGLSNDLASPQTYRILADMIEAGVDRTAIEQNRREYSKMPPRIYRYKAHLIERTVFSHDNQVASVSISQDEINEFSPLYNPGPLIQGDMLQISGVKVAIVFKNYKDGKVTGAIRSNAGYPIAAKLAERFGGGGHAFASGFKVTDGRSFKDIAADCLQVSDELLNELYKSEN